jgi:hypothetical protein
MSLAMYASPYENETDDITHSKKQIVTNKKNLRKTVKKPVTNKVANFMKKLQQQNNIDVDDDVSPIEEDDDDDDDGDNLADYNRHNDGNDGNDDNDNHDNDKVVDNYSSQMPIMPFYNSNIDSSAPVAAATAVRRIPVSSVPVPESDELMQKLNHIIELLEKQEHEKSDSVAEELILYCFLGIFVIFIVDSFARAGKYVR